MARKVSMGFCDYHIHHLKEFSLAACLYSSSRSVDRHLGLYAFYMLSNIWQRFLSIKLTTEFEVCDGYVCDAKCTALLFDGVSLTRFKYRDEFQP
jgi:hypothetical protein